MQCCDGHVSAVAVNLVPVSMLVDVDQLISEYMQTKHSMTSQAGNIAKQFGSLGIVSTGSYQVITGSSPFFSSQKTGSGMLLIDRDQKLLDHAALSKDPANVSASINSSSERFFFRVSGVMQQLMLGQSK